MVLILKIKIPPSILFLLDIRGPFFLSLASLSFSPSFHALTAYSRGGANVCGVCGGRQKEEREKDRKRQIWQICLSLKQMNRAKYTAADKWTLRWVMASWQPSHYFSLSTCFNKDFPLSLPSSFWFPGMDKAAFGWIIVRWGDYLINWIIIIIINKSRFEIMKW